MFGSSAVHICRKTLWWLLLLLLLLLDLIGSFTCSSFHAVNNKPSFSQGLREDGIYGEKWWQSQFIVTAFNVKSHSPAFNLPVDPPELSISSVTRASSNAPNHSSHCWNFHRRRAIGPSLPKQLHSTTLHTNIISDSEAVKGSCVSSRTDRNSQTNAPQLTADNAEGRLLSGRNPISSHTGAAFIAQGSKWELCEQVWRSWWKQPDHQELVTVHGSEATFTFAASIQSQTKDTRLITSKCSQLVSKNEGSQEDSRNQHVGFYSFLS